LKKSKVSFQFISDLFGRNFHDIICCVGDCKGKKKKLSNYKGEGDWRVDLEERLVGKLNKCSLFQAECEVGRKEEKNSSITEGGWRGKIKVKCSYIPKEGGW
jgi:hypothetical protein